MNARNMSWLVAFFVLVGADSSIAIDLRSVCRAAMSPDFAEIMGYIAGGGETCNEMKCMSAPAILGRKTHIEVAQASTKTDLIPELKSDVDDAVDEINSAIEIDFGIGFDDADSYIYLVLVSADSIVALSNGEVKGIDGLQFSSFISPALKVSKCAGMVTHYSEAGSRKIEKAIIFIPDTIENRGEIRRCVYEELLNATGLLRDPPGSASLFDNQNFREVGGKLVYSESTLAMLFLHYAIAYGNYRELSNFIDLECEEEKMREPP